MDIWTSLGAFAFFESERLSFRPLIFLDRFDLHEIVSNPQNLQFFFPATQTQHETDCLLVHYFMKEPLGVWAIVDKELEKMIGVVRFEKIDVQKRTAELGYFLNASYWGRGLMTEAVTCLSNLALTAMGMDRIILIAHLENKASIRVAEKSGFKLVSRFKGADRYTRTMRDYLRFEKEENCEYYLEALPIGKRVSVRSISNHLQVSDGTAYRAIKEAENRGLVETRPRSGTVRIEKKVQVRLDKLTFAEIAEITESEVISGHEGLERVFSKFYIGAMTIENITRYLTKGDLLIVGDREDIQLLALEHNNAILVTGGFQVSDRVKELSRLKQFPVMVTTYDTFTVATMINQALSNVRIKTDIKTVAQVYTRREDYNYMTPEMTVRDFQNLVKRTNLVRFPILSEADKVIGIVTMRDVSNQQPTTMLKAIMTKPTVTRLETSLATVAQKMIFEDFDIIPVVDEEKHYLGVITRRQVLEELQDNNRGNLHTFSDQMIANLNQDKHAFSFEVEPTMIDNSGNLTQGVLAEMVKEVVYRIMEKQEQNGLVIEEMMFYFLQAAQIDDKVTITPSIIAETRRRAHLDLMVTHGNHTVCKSVVVVKKT